MLLPKRFQATNNRGFTLVELVISIVVIATTLVALNVAFTSLLRPSADSMLVVQSLATAEGYLEEILGRGFVDPDDGTVCPTPEASRESYDNLCDYNNLDDSGARDQFGNPITGLEGFRVRVSVDSGYDLNGVNGGKAIHVLVRVTHPASIDMSLSGYRTDF